MNNHTATTSPQTTAEAEAWLAQYSPKHRMLAALMDTIVSNYYHASCMGDEAARAYDLLVEHAKGRTEAIDMRFDEVLRADVDAAIKLMRELGGAWGGEGCLYQTAYQVEEILGANPYELELADIEVNQWFTLEQLAAQTGHALPPA